MFKLKKKTIKRIIEILILKRNREGYYQTTWGNKSEEGLRATIEAIIKEEQEYKI
jgi:hypothetical protein